MCSNLPLLAPSDWLTNLLPVSAHCSFSFSPAVSPILDKQSGQAVALVVIGEDGRQFVVTLDPQQPSRLLLQDKATRGLYAL